MPLFEYRCEDCGEKFDAFFRRAEDAENEEISCPACSSTRVRKLFSLLGIGGSESSDLSSGGSCSSPST